MKTSELTILDTRDLVGNPKNPRKITNESLNRLCDSIRQNGFWVHRPIAVERQEWTDKYVVLDGNQRLKALQQNCCSKASARKSSKASLLTLARSERSTQP